ncbi:Actin/actin-like protein [Sarocladium strictum]
MAGQRKQKPAPSPRPANTLVVDNGGNTIKAGLVRGFDIPEPSVIPNCIARDRARKTYVASELDKCRDLGEVQFRRPVEKGSVVSWDAQRAIWDAELIGPASRLKCDPSETRLVLGEAPNSLPALQLNCDQMVFEEYGFASYFRGISPAFNAYHDVQSLFRTPQDGAGVANSPAEIMLVVDSGFSHTTVTPVLRGQPLQSAIRRVDIGGKMLTSYLTRLLSLRHFDMRNDSHTVNHMKEVSGFVSLDFNGDLERSWKGTRGRINPEWKTGAGIAKDYILPDFHTRTKGVIQEYDPARHIKAKQIAAGGQAEEDAVTLRNERFTVPELIFSPSDIGMQQPGLADAIRESLDGLPIGLWPGLLANIVVVGGNALFDGFIQRLQKEVVQRFPDDCVVRVARPENPITSSVVGGMHLANHVNIERVVVTKQEYEERGATWVANKFATGLQTT